MAEFKSGRGGARKGAGRPPGKGKSRVGDRDRRERIGIRLPAHMIEWLRDQRNINPGRLIETALTNTYGREIEKNEKK
jgi:hypothetical protein